MKVKKTHSNSLYFINVVKNILYYFIIIVLLYCTLSISIQKPQIIQKAKERTFFVLSPFLNIASAPFNIIMTNADLATENKMKEEITQTFLNVQSAKLEFAINELLKFKNTIIELNIGKFELILFNPQYYSSTGLLTDVIFNQSKIEKANDIKINSAVISNTGLYGRVASVYKNKINIISIFNFKSRIPVYTKSSNIYAVAAGGGFEINLIHTNESIEKVIEGEEVWTSGEGDLITSDIPLGVLKKMGNRYIIIPFTKTHPFVLGIINNKHER